MQFLYISASFGFFGFEEVSCSDILPLLVSLLEFYEECTMTQQSSLDLLYLGLKINRSFDLIYKQAIEGAQAFAARTNNSQIILKSKGSL